MCVDTVRPIIVFFFLFLHLFIVTQERIQARLLSEAWLVGWTVRDGLYEASFFGDMALCAKLMKFELDVAREGRTRTVLGS
jgi:hypothetical protein